MQKTDTNPSPPNHWAQHAIFWHIYPLGFVGAEPQSSLDQGVIHRLGHIERWLDYAVELGCSALALGPIFASHTHGYDTLDYMKIDPRLGDEADFDSLVGAAHRRGLKVVLDGVFNHVGRGFPQLRDAVERAERSAFASWFRRKSQRPDDFVTFEGHHALVTLNHEEPEVAAFVTRVMKHWLARGADGFRLDAAYSVPSSFWHRVLPEVRRDHPAAWFFGEVIHGDYSKYVRDSGLDSITQYELWKAIWSAINDKNLFELAWAIERHARFVEAFLPLTFVGNHDVTRIASRLKDERHLAHALVALFMLPGVPSVYAGDEQAFRGIKEERVGGDDAIRPTFPADAGQLAPYGWPTYRLHQALIALRRRHPWLQSARVDVESRTNPAIVFRCSENTPHDHHGHRGVRSVGASARALTVALNLADTPFPVQGPARRLLASDDDRPGVSFEPLEVSAHGFLICERAAHSG